MNVYFLNLEDINEDRLPFLLDILKVKKIICYTDKCPKICEPLLIYNANYNEQDNDEQINMKIKQAVYKFNAPICSPNVENEKWTGNFRVNNIYRNSNAFNPIYNLEHCDDDNVLVLLSILYFSYQFPKYSLNILKKYAFEYHYEYRICFIQLFFLNNEYTYYSFPHGTTMFNNGNFYPLRRFIQILPESISGEYYELDSNRSYSKKEIYELKKQGKNVYGRYYDPLISYIDIKLNELYPQERNGLDILDFFKYEGYLNELFTKKIEEREKYESEIYHSQDDTYSYAEEVEYIRDNGGDWIYD